MEAPLFQKRYSSLLDLLPVASHAAKFLRLRKAFNSDNAYYIIVYIVLSCTVLYCTVHHDVFQVSRHPGHAVWSVAQVVTGRAVALRSLVMRHPPPCTKAVGVGVAAVF